MSEKYFLKNTGENIGILSCRELRNKEEKMKKQKIKYKHCLLYTSPSPRDLSTSRMPSSA